MYKLYYISSISVNEKHMEAKSGYGNKKGLPRILIQGSLYDILG
jgi:hypothetical protein